MGQRANYVIKEGGAVALYYSHWGGTSVDRDLFFGPAHALAFIRSQRPTTEWLDQIWCEGGALVDRDRQLLLIFGGEDIRFDVLGLRVHLAMMRRLWTGWTVRWVHDGLAAFTDHLGLARELVTTASERELHPPWHRPEFADHPRAILSTPDGLYPLEVAAHELLAYPTPPALDPSMRRAHIRERLHVDAISSGAHLDPDARRLDLWGNDYGWGYTQWPGWTVRHHGDRFELHVEQCSGELELLTEAQADVVARTAKRMRGPGAAIDPTQMLADIVARHPGQNVEVNPHFLAHTNVELSDDERARLVTFASAELPRLW